MFNRRRASTGAHIPRSHSQSQPAASSAAATAATQAFLKNRSSNASLSSAAAAAALRSHTSSPTPVGDLQTKRMRRRDSNGSIVSVATTASQRLNLPHRSPSNGSLSERTLRSPSPRRTPLFGATTHAPPVPALPNHPTKQNVPSRQRAFSLEHVGRVGSPTSKPNSRGASLDAGTRSDGHTPKLSRTLSRVDEVPNHSARRSINFSRPISPQSSPKAPVGQQRQTGWFTGPVVTGNPPRRSQKSLSTFTHASAQPKLKGAGSAEVLGPSNDSTITSDLPAKIKSTGGLETSRWVLPPQAGITATADAGLSKSKSSSPGNGIRPEQEGQERTITTPVKQEPANSEEQAVERRDLLSSAKPEGSSLRRHSISPPRAAHFDANGAVIINGVRHEPPGRSMSPTKSALKTSSPGTGSFSSTVLTKTQDINGYIAASEGKRKKSVRISVEVKPGEEESVGLKSSKFAPSTPVKVKPNGNEDFDDFMGPRPVLPSFGSVRDPARDQNLEHAADHRIGALLGSSKDAIVQDDQASPSILRQNLLAGKGARREDGENKQGRENSPLLTGKNTPRSESDEELSRITQIDGANVRAADFHGKDKDDHNSHVTSQSVAITLQPPTPNADADQWVVPGAFPDATDSAYAEQEQNDTPNHNKREMLISFQEPMIPDESSDEDSIYEDASEALDPSGFASLDRMVQESTPAQISKVTREYIGDARPPLQTIESRGSVDTLALDKRLEEARLNSEAREAQKVQNTQKAQDLYITPERKPQSNKTSRPRESTTISKVSTPPSALHTSKWSPAHTTDQSTPPRSNDFKLPSPPSSRQKVGGSAGPASRFASRPKRSESPDSVSSFKRNRASSPVDQGRYSLRQSMRGASPSGGSVTSAYRGSSLRAQSPNASASPMRSMRSSMRSGLRERSFSNDETMFRRNKSPSRISRILRPSKNKPAESISSGPRGRFATGSDADISAPRFVSRFADSDDDLPSSQLPSPMELTPVRGIPRRKGQDDDDSTELEDSDLEQTQRLPPVPSVKDVDQAYKQTNGGGATSSQSIAGLASSKHAPRPSGHKKWHSFLHIGHHNKSPAPPATVDLAVDERVNVDSPLRPQRPTGKLRRKSYNKSPSRRAEESWPLYDAPVPRIGELNDARPMSADGVTRKPRLAIGKRRSTTEDVLKWPLDVDGDKGNDSGPANEGVLGPINSEQVEDHDKDKKKRFGKIRRMIGRG